MKKLLTLSIVCALFAFTKVQSQEIQVPLSAPEKEQSTQLQPWGWGAPNLVKIITNSVYNLTFEGSRCLFVRAGEVYGLTSVTDNLTGITYYATSMELEIEKLILDNSGNPDMGNPENYQFIPWNITVRGNGQIAICYLDNIN